MLLNSDNETDKQLAQTYSKRAINNINPEKIGFLGMNVNIDAQTDIKFKLYCNPDYSIQIAKRRNINAESETYIKFLQDENIKHILEIIDEKQKRNVTRYNTFVYPDSKEAVEKIFKFLKENIYFYEKYEEEIKKLSLFNNTIEDKFNPPFCIGFSKTKGNINILKMYWDYVCLKGNDYVEFCNIKELNDILPYARKIMENCNGREWMIGIDYDQNNSGKHKIYVNTKHTENPFLGLLKTFPNKPVFETQIKAINEWLDVHNEFRCHGFAIGKNNKNELTLNIYFSYSKKQKSK